MPATEAMDPAYLHRQAQAEARAGRPAAAIALLRQALTLAPGLQPARNDLGALLIAMGEPEAAERELRIVVAADPAAAEPRVNLGNALHAQGRLETANAEYRAALALNPGHVRGLVSLGNLLLQQRDAAGARDLLLAAERAAPGTAAVHQFLGNAWRDLGELAAAEASYRQAIALDAASADAHENLGLMLRGQARYDEAIAHLRAAGTPYARALALDCELRRGQVDGFFAHLAQHADAEAANLHSASLSAWAAEQLDRPDPHPFCPAPLGQVRVAQRYSGEGDRAFLAALIAEAGSQDALWEPRGVTTIGGFQTGGNLFGRGLPALGRLEGELLAALRDYHASLPATAGIAARWPARTRLRGWFVRLLSGGHQLAHNHPEGWVSGCLYLQVPPAGATGAGAIEFSLGGAGFPPLSARVPPTRLHQPQPGELVLFPASLYHRTLPFESATERLCIAFDLQPAP